MSENNTFNFSCYIIIRKFIMLFIIIIIIFSFSLPNLFFFSIKIVFTSKVSYSSKFLFGLFPLLSTILFLSFTISLFLSLISDLKHLHFSIKWGMYIWFSSKEKALSEFSWSLLIFASIIKWLSILSFKKFKLRCLFSKTKIYN